MEMQVVQVCAEHKKPAKLLKHLTHIKVPMHSRPPLPPSPTQCLHTMACYFLHDLVSCKGNPTMP